MIRYARRFPFSDACIRRALLVAATHPLAGWAQTTATEPPGVSGSAIVQMLLGLTLIIGLLFAGAYLLRKLNGDVAFELDIAPDLTFAMEQQDVEEVVGNLLENASRFARTKVVTRAVVTTREDDVTDGRRGWIEIVTLGSSLRG